MSVGHHIEIGRWNIYLSLWLHRDWALNGYSGGGAVYDARWRSYGIACGPLDVFAFVEVRR